MAFWSNLFGSGVNHEGVAPNDNPPTSVGGDDWRPGDPDGVQFEGEPVESRALPMIIPSPWDGWPAEWSTPAWGGVEMTRLVDTAWDCIDLNASILSSLPVYRTQGGRIVEPKPWMVNPDPLIYASWQEFANQLFWEYQLGEAFVLATSYFADTYPRTFRVIPASLVNVEVVEGVRTYRIGQRDVTADMLHIRYRSTTDPNQPRGVGPLAAAGARIVTIGVLQRYVQNLSETGGRPLWWITSDKVLDQDDANEYQKRVTDARRRNAGEPAVLGKGATVGQAQAMSAKDMALLEISQWNESRIATKLGVPPYVLGLPSGGDSMTYSNVSQLFTFHDRAWLRPKANAVMSALSNWLLPAGQAVELNRDEYTRPELKERAEAYEILTRSEILGVAEAQRMERFDGPTPAERQAREAQTQAASALSGGDQS